MAVGRAAPAHALLRPPSGSRWSLGLVVVEGVERPYAVVLRGGYPAKDLYQISGDGLTYTTLSLKDLDTALQPGVSAALAPQVTPQTDYGQTPIASNLFRSGCARS